MTPPAAAAPAVRRARVAAPARPLPSTPRPRRVSGPVRRERPRPQTGRSTEADGGLALGALAALRSAERHPLLDRLIGGRTWIALVAFALLGIVTLQLGLLKLNAGIGRTLEQEASLQQQNATLSIENSELAAGDRVEARAAQLGMELVPAGSLRSLTPRGHLDATHAAAALNTTVREAAVSETSAASSSVSTASSAGSESSTPATETAPTGEASVHATGASSGGEASSATGESSSSTSTSSTSTVAPVSTSQPSASSAGAGAASEATPAGGQAAPTG
jgi:cell division protein FtsL